MINATHLINIKICFIAAILCCTLLSCFTPNRISKPDSIDRICPIGKHGLWGYADETGKVVIPYKYEAAEFFTSGLAAVKTDGKYGFINNLGEFEIKPKFDTVIHKFGFEAAYVNHRGNSLWINRKGKQLKDYTKVFSNDGTLYYTANPNDYFSIDGNKYMRSVDLVIKVSLLRKKTSTTFTYPIMA